MFGFYPYKRGVVFCWIQNFHLRSGRLQAQAATLDDEGLQFLGVVGRRFRSLNAWESKGRGLISRVNVAFGRGGPLRFP